MNAILRAITSVTGLLPDLRCWPWRHDWNDLTSVPASCRRCGITGWPLAALHDVFDTGD